MGHRRHLLLPLPTLLVLAACEDEILQKLPEPETQVDELKQKPAALVDILWVVDNSGSMLEEQTALAANFEKFITGLTTCQGSGMANDICDFNTKKCAVSGAPCNPPDYHIGVVSTDVRTPTDTGRLKKVGLCVPSAGASPVNGRYDYCTQSSHCTGDAANGVCDLNQSLSFVTPTTPGASSAFARAVQVGITGSGLETGIRAAALAVGRDANRATGEWTPAPTENSGFLRPDASLFMIFVSDEDDSSFGEVPYFYRAFETLKGAGNEAQISVSAIVGDPDVDGETGQSRGGCPAPPVEVTAAPGGRYVSLAMYSRGLGSELRVCDDRRLTCPEGNSCQKPVPGLPGICIPSGQCAVDQDCGNFKCTGDKGCIPCSNARCTADPGLFLELLSRNGVFGSICAPDYGVVLGSLGFEAAGLARKFQLTKFPDCAKNVKCCDKDVAEEACMTTERVCVRVNGKVIPNERQAGWVYEPGSNAVFFDGSYVPPTDASIEVLYKKSGADKALSCETAIR